MVSELCHLITRLRLDGRHPATRPSGARASSAGRVMCSVTLAAYHLLELWGDSPGLLASPR